MWFTCKHESKQVDSLSYFWNNMFTQYNYYPTEHRDLNTWYIIHNDGNNQWIVFEYEWVIFE